MLRICVYTACMHLCLGLSSYAPTQGQLVKIYHLLNSILHPHSPFSTGKDQADLHLSCNVPAVACHSVTCCTTA